MPAGKRAVGERIYVFSLNGGQQNFQNVVIDAHGEQKIFGSTFPLAAGKRVVFYVPQGAAQRYHNGTVTPVGGASFNYTNALKAISTGAATEDSHVDGPAQCPDYNLEKIQKTDTGCGAAFTNWIDERNDMVYNDVVAFINHYAVDSDIVTIRNRKGKMAITLSEVIAALGAGGYNYAQFRCSFCRSAQPGALWQPSAAARQVTGADRPGGGTY